MEVSYIEINDCCRCCMGYFEELDNIFECFYKNLELFEILSLITGLNITQDDSKSSKHPQKSYKLKKIISSLSTIDLRRMQGKRHAGFRLSRDLPQIQHGNRGT